MDVMDWLRGWRGLLEPTDERYSTGWRYRDAVERYRSILDLLDAAPYLVANATPEALLRVTEALGRLAATEGDGDLDAMSGQTVEAARNYLRHSSRERWRPSPPGLREHAQRQAVGLARRLRPLVSARLRDAKQEAAARRAVRESEVQQARGPDGSEAA